MDDLNVDLMSISSNSSSQSDEEELQPKRKKAKKQKTQRQTKYPLKVTHMSKRIFDQIYRRLKRNKPIIAVKTQSLERSNCNRFTLAQIEGNQMETISPESTTRLMWEMRECVQRKEYHDLARLISVFTEMPMGKKRWYPTLIKYCLIVLMYDPLVQGTGLMDMFLDGVMGCHTDADKKEFLRDISQLPNNIHVTKYDELWTDYPLPKQLNQPTLDKLCEILNKKLDIKMGDDDADDSDENWESFDENSSDEENEETTEAEAPYDLSAVLNRLQNSVSK